MTLLKSTLILGIFCLFILTCTYLYLESKISNLSRQLHLQQAGGGECGGGLGAPVLIYNRVPKTGSTSLMNVAYELHAANRFRVVQVRVTQYKHILTLSDQMSLLRNMSGWSTQPTLYHGHFSFMDLAGRLGGGLASGSPVYWVNLVRKPLDRLVSHYYFLRYGDDVLTSKVRAKEGDTTTFDDCVRKGQTDCDPRKLWMQVPFFCGHAAQCWEPGSEWALAQAKNNLVTKYLVVGHTEDLDSFVEVLEILLPHFFKGGAEFLTLSGKSHIKKTRHKDELNEETVRKMKASKVWRLENEFYNFAVKQFQSIKKTVIKQKQMGGATFYNFEKVRPKPN